MPFEALFDHTHDVMLANGGLLATATGHTALSVNSVHHQGIDRLGAGLNVEAVSTEDGLVEGFSASPCGAPVLVVQWHPEWNGAACPSGQAFSAFWARLCAVRYPLRFAA